MPLRNGISSFSVLHSRRSRTMMLSHHEHNNSAIQIFFRHKSGQKSSICPYLMMTTISIVQGAGVIYASLGDYGKAAEYLEKLVKVREIICCDLEYALACRRLLAWECGAEGLVLTIRSACALSPFLILPINFQALHGAQDGTGAFKVKASVEKISRISTIPLSPAQFSVLVPPLAGVLALTLDKASQQSEICISAEEQS
jgi:hypothetical protein